jgi:hypothetical protein
VIPRWLAAYHLLAGDPPLAARYCLLAEQLFPARRNFIACWLAGYRQLTNYHPLAHP